MGDLTDQSCKFLGGGQARKQGSANTAEAADSSPGIPAILRQCFTNWLFRNLGAFQESSSATFYRLGRLARDPPNWIASSFYWAVEYLMRRVARTVATVLG